MIEAINLNKTYIQKEKNGLLKPKTVKQINAVNNINISVPTGKIVGLLGINGAGKTTTIKMLSAVVQPTSGKISIDGIDAVKNYMKVKNRLNMISGGERNLYWRLTAKENLSYFGSLYGLYGKELNMRISSTLEMVGLNDKGDIPVERFSKGMKQRLQIARGIINDPKYIFLDEPTLGLDIFIAKEMRKYIRNLAVEDEKGILLTTHYISEAEELCDYIYVIEKGTVIAQGTMEELRHLLKNKKETIITVDKLSKPTQEKLLSIVSDSNDSITFKEEEQTSIIIRSVKNYMPQVVSLLNTEGSQIFEIKVNEANLEDVLFSIIKNARNQ